MTKLKIFLLICVVVCVNMLFSLKMRKETTEVVFWTVQLAPFSEYLEGVISEFEESHPSIKIKWIDVPYSEAEKRVLASLLSNSMPDLINITSDFNMTLASKGALEPIEGNMNAYNKSLVNALKYNENVWGVPFYATSAITIYNKELLKDFDIPNPPETYDELFLQMAKAPALTNKYLFMPTLTENDTLYKILNKYDINTPDGLETQKSQEIFSDLQALYTNNKIPKEAITQTHREVLEKYSSGQIAYLQAGANFLNIIMENSLDVYNKTDVTEQFCGDKKEYDFSLMTLAIPARAKNKDEALLFAKFITNSRNQLELAKKTGVLPCNRMSLQDEYFTNYDKNDLVSKARYIGAKQLSNPISYPQQKRNHKDVIVLINSLVEQILLQKMPVLSQLQKAAAKWAVLDKN